VADGWCGSLWLAHWCARESLLDRFLLVTHSARLCVNRALIAVKLIAVLWGDIREHTVFGRDRSAAQAHTALRGQLLGTRIRQPRPSALGVLALVVAMIGAPLRGRLVAGIGARLRTSTPPAPTRLTALGLTAIASATHVEDLDAPSTPRLPKALIQLQRPLPSERCKKVGSSSPSCDTVPQTSLLT
jgi:hypothetical protein